jgi:hypothetical protein
MGADMKFLIRVDDIGMTPEESPMPPGKNRDHGLELAKKFNDAMQGVPWLAAVVPAMLDEDGVAWLKQAKGVDVALHGWDHCEADGCRNEFENLSIDSCRWKISNGQLRVGPTPYFVPPWNAYTPNFIEAAWHEGIRHIFAAPVQWETPPSPVELARGVKLWPAWSSLYGSLAWTQGCKPILNTLPDLLGKKGKAVLTLHITWISARDPEFVSVRTFARMIAQHAISAQEFTS